MSMIKVCEVEYGWLEWNRSKTRQHKKESSHDSMSRGGSAVNLRCFLKHFKKMLPFIYPPIGLTKIYKGIQDLVHCISKRNFNVVLIKFMWPMFHKNLTMPLEPPWDKKHKGNLNHIYLSLSLDATLIFFNDGIY